MIVLILPYPISANRYWRPVNLGKHISIVPTKEARQYREQVGWIARGAGAKAPLQGRLAVDLKLYPNRPQDWRTRQRKFGAAWDDSVQCIDLTNAEKVLMDALNGVAFNDDKQVRRYTAERMEPDERGARVVLTIQAIAEPAAQRELEVEAQ
jgi:crossover junction endodeoxyribonuclease RusA